MPYNPNEILDFAVVAFKAHAKVKVGRLGEVKDIPEHSAVYVENVRHSNHLRVHVDGDFPEAMFAKASPNETEEELSYRRDNFRPITKPGVAKAMTTIKKIWNPANYKITYPTLDTVPEDEQPTKYFKENYPKFNSLENYFESVIPDNQIKDPNAVIAVKPLHVPVEIIDGHAQRVDNERIKPMAILYTSKQRVMWDDTYSLIQLEETVDLNNGREGLVFEFYDATAIYRIVQTGDYSDGTFQVDLIYTHNMGEVPVYVLRGTPMVKDEVLYWKSHLAPALPDLDNALDESSTLQISIKKHAYPQKYRFERDCSRCEGTGIADYSDGQEVECKYCKGTGIKGGESSPLKDYVIHVDGDFDQNKTLPPPGILQQETKYLEFLEKKIEKDIVRAIAHINIDISTTNVKGSETATGIVLNREESFAFLLTISHQQFYLIEVVGNAMGKMRYNEPTRQRWTGMVVNPPKDFKIRGEREILEEIEAARKIGDKLTVKRLTKDLWLLRFAKSSEGEAVVNTIMAVDTLLGMEDEIILASLGRGVAVWEKILHEKIDVFIDQAIEDNSNFLNTPMADRRNILTTKAQEYEQMIAPTAPTIPFVGEEE